MARSVEELFNEMVAEKQTLAELSALLPNNIAQDSAWLDFAKNVDSDSVTATWRLWLYLSSLAAHDQEVLWDDFEAKVNATLAAQRVAVKEWYRRQALAYQDGYDLLWINDKWQYAVNDDNAKIIAQCSVLEISGGGLRVKVATDDGSGNLQALSPAQLVRFNAYMNRIKYAGRHLVSVSFSADIVNALFAFKYDALFDLVPLKLAVKSAVKNYLKSIDFQDGKVNLNRLIDFIQKVPGVEDAVPVDFEGKYGALPYSSFLAQGEYPTNAGYAELDEAIFDLATWTAI